MPIDYRSVNYLAYRTSVTYSAARRYATEAREVARAAKAVRLRGGPDHYHLLKPEVERQLARVDDAFVRADRAERRCEGLSYVDPKGPVIFVEDESRHLWPEDEDTRRAVQDCLSEIRAAGAEAHLGLDLISALHARLLEVRDGMA